MKDVSEILDQVYAKGGVLDQVYAKGGPIDKAYEYIGGNGDAIGSEDRAPRLGYDMSKEPEEKQRKYKKVNGVAVNNDYDDIINQASLTYNVNPYLLKSLIYQESGFHSDADSEAGAIGLTQVMPKTYETIVKEGLLEGVTGDPAELRDPKISINAGAAYLRKMLDETTANNGGVEDARLALAAYNMGPAGLKRRKGDWSSVAETNGYVNRIAGANGIYEAYSKMGEFEKYKTADAPQEPVAGQGQAADGGTKVRSVSAPEEEKSKGFKSFLDNHISRSLGRVMGSTVSGVGALVEMAGGKEAGRNIQQIGNIVVEDNQEGTKAERLVGGGLDIAFNVASFFVPGTLVAKGATALGAGAKAAQLAGVAASSTMDASLIMGDTKQRDMKRRLEPLAVASGVKPEDAAKMTSVELAGMVKPKFAKELKSAEEQSTRNATITGLIMAPVSAELGLLGDLYNVSRAVTGTRADKVIETITKEATGATNKTFVAKATEVAKYAANAGEGVAPKVLRAGAEGAQEGASELVTQAMSGGVEDGKWDAGAILINTAIGAAVQVPSDFIMQASFYSEHKGNTKKLLAESQDGLARNFGIEPADIKGYRAEKNVEMSIDQFYTREVMLDQPPSVSLVHDGSMIVTTKGENGEMVDTRFVNPKFQKANVITAEESTGSEFVNDLIVNGDELGAAATHSRVTGPLRDKIEERFPAVAEAAKKGELQSFIEAGLMVEEALGKSPEVSAYRTKLERDTQGAYAAMRANKTPEAKQLWTELSAKLEQVKSGNIPEDVLAKVRARMGIVTKEEAPAVVEQIAKENNIELVPEVVKMPFDDQAATMEKIASGEIKPADAPITEVVNDGGNTVQNTGSPDGEVAQGTEVGGDIVPVAKDEPTGVKNKGDNTSVPEGSKEVASETVAHIPEGTPFVPDTHPDLPVATELINNIIAATVIDEANKRGVDVTPEEIDNAVKSISITGKMPEGSSEQLPDIVTKILDDNVGSVESNDIHDKVSSIQDATTKAPEVVKQVIVSKPVKDTRTAEQKKIDDIAKRKAAIEAARLRHEQAVPKKTAAEPVKEETQTPEPATPKPTEAVNGVQGKEEAGKEVTPVTAKEETQVQKVTEPSAVPTEKLQPAAKEEVAPTEVVQPKKETSPVAKEETKTEPKIKKNEPVQAEKTPSVEEKVIDKKAEEPASTPYLSPAWNVIGDNEYSMESIRLLTSRTAKAELDARYGIELIDKPDHKTLTGKMIFRNKSTGTMFGLTNDQVEMGNAMFMNTDTRYGFVAAASDVANGISKSDVGVEHKKAIVGKLGENKKSAGRKVSLSPTATPDETMLYFASQLAKDSKESVKTLNKLEVLKGFGANESVWNVVRDSILAGKKIDYAKVAENISMVSADISGTTKGSLSKANVQTEQSVSRSIKPQTAQDWGLTNKRHKSRGEVGYGEIKASDLMTKITEEQMTKMSSGNENSRKFVDFLNLMKTSPDMVRRSTARLVIKGDKLEVKLEYIPEETNSSKAASYSYDENKGVASDDIRSGFESDIYESASDQAPTVQDGEEDIVGAVSTEDISINEEEARLEDIKKFNIARATDTKSIVSEDEFNDLYMQRLAGAEKDVKSKGGITLGDLGPAVYDAPFSVGTRLVFVMRADASPSAVEANKVMLDPVQMAQASKFARQCVDIFDKLGHSTEGMKELAQDPDLRNTRGLISHILALDPSEARTVADVENLRELNNLAADMYDRIRKPITDFEARMSIFGDEALKELVARGDVSKEDGALMMAMYRALKMNANIVAIDNLKIPSGIRAFISEATNTIGFKTTNVSRVQSFTHELVHAGFRSLPAQAKKDYNNAFFNTQYNVHPDGKVEFAPSSYQNRAAQNSMEYGALDVLFPVARLGAIDEMIAEAGARKLLIQETPIGIISQTWKKIWDKVEGLYKALRASFQIDPSIDRVMNAIIKQRGFSQRLLVEEHAKAMEELDQAIANGPMGKDVAPAGIPEGYLFNYDEEVTGEIIAPPQSTPLAVVRANQQIAAGDYLGKIAQHRALSEIADLRDMLINREDIPHSDMFDLIIKLHKVVAIMPSGNVVIKTALTRSIARISKINDAEYVNFREKFIKANEYAEQKKMLARVRSKVKTMRTRYGASGEKLTKEEFSGAELGIVMDGKHPLPTVYKIVMKSASMRKISESKVQEIDYRINRLNEIPDSSKSPLWFKQMIELTTKRSDAERQTTESMSVKQLGALLHALEAIEQAHKDVTGSKYGIKQKSATEKHRAEMSEAVKTRLKLVGNSKERKNILDAVVDVARAYRTGATPQMFLAQVLDSYNPDGVFTRLFAKASISAKSKQLGMQQDLFDFLTKQLKKNKVDMKDVSQHGMVSPDRDSFIKHGGGFRYVTENGVELLITKGEAIALAGTAMDPDGYDGMVRDDVYINGNPYKLTDKDIHGITKRVNDNETMKSVLMSLRNLYDYNGRKYVRDFIAKTSGNDIDLEPNHYPLKRKSAGEKIVEDIKIGQESTDNMLVRRKSGSMKERQRNAKGGLVIEDPFIMAAKIITSTARDIAVRPVAIQMMTDLTSVRDVMSDSGMHDEYETMKKWIINDVAGNAEFDIVNKNLKWAFSLERRFSSSALLLNVPNLFNQAMGGYMASLSPFLKRPLGYVSKVFPNAADVLSIMSPELVTKKTYYDNSKILHYAKNLSPIVRDRLESIMVAGSDNETAMSNLVLNKISKAYHSENKAKTGTVGSSVKEFLRNTEEMLSVLTNKTDAIAIANNVRSAMELATREGLVPYSPEFNDHVRDNIESTILFTQPTMTGIDKAPFLKNPVFRLTFAALASQRSKILGSAAVSIGRLATAARAKKAGVDASYINVAEEIQRLGMTVLFNAIIMSLTKIIGKTVVSTATWAGMKAAGDEESWWEEMSKDPYFGSWEGAGIGVAKDIASATTGILIGLPSLITVASMFTTDLAVQAVSEIDTDNPILGKMQEMAGQSVEDAPPTRLETGGALVAIGKAAMAAHTIATSMIKGESLGDMKKSTVTQSMGISGIPTWGTKILWGQWEVMRDNTEMFQ